MFYLLLVIIVFAVIAFSVYEEVLRRKGIKKFTSSFKIAEDDSKSFSTTYDEEFFKNGKY